MLYDHQPANTQPASHYESTFLKSDSTSFIYQAKQNAFLYMSQLEGWCSKSKASVLIDFVFAMKPNVIVEIGVWGGKSLVPMGYILKVNKQGKAYGIDPWNPIASIEGMDGVNYDWWKKVDHLKILHDLQARILLYDLNDQIELIQATSQDAPIIENIDILHIDGNHSEAASVLDFYKWVPLVRKGGIILFDDITWTNEQGSNRKAVELLDEQCIRLFTFHDEFNATDWAVWVKP